MKINVLTLFPEVFESFLNSSILKRAITEEKVEINFYNFRDQATSKNRAVDDTSYGGGAGMVLKVEPVHKCLQKISSSALTIALTPTGEVFNDKTATKLSKLDEITILCGHYEGFDERVYDYVDLELSIGDYILTGGETAALVLIDAISRKVEGVINSESVENDSFSNNIFDYPVYTKPLEYDGKKVPEVLLSGNHKRIEEFRYEKALEKTYLRRRDLIDKHLSNLDKNVLKKIVSRLGGSDEEDC